MRGIEKQNKGVRKERSERERERERRVRGKGERNVERGYDRR